MGRIIRVKINWTGFPGGPGFTNLYFEPVPESDPITQATVDNAVSKVQTFLAAWRPYLPASIMTGVDATVDELDEQTGTLETFWVATVAAPAFSSGTTAYSAASGGCITWQTGGVRNGRRVRGRTFMVPLGTNAYDNDGTLLAATLTAVRPAATALTADSGGSRLVIWSRPNSTIPIDGGAYDVVSASVSDRVAILTSRRS